MDAGEAQTMPKFQCARCEQFQKEYELDGFDGPSQSVLERVSVGRQKGHESDDFGRRDTLLAPGLGRAICRIRAAPWSKRHQNLPILLLVPLLLVLGLWLLWEDQLVQGLCAMIVVFGTLGVGYLAIAIELRHAFRRWLLFKVEEKNAIAGSASGSPNFAPSGTTDDGTGERVRRRTHVRKS
jgi:hypothetical protein